MNRKYFKIGIHHIAVHYDTQTVFLCGENGNNIELKIIQSKEEVRNIETYKTKEEGGFREEITAAEFQQVFSNVVQKAGNDTPYA